MQIKKKNKILTFFSSMIPGGAQMYMGLMKSGASMLAIFMTCFALLLLGRLDFFMAPMGLIWIYSFYHAWNVVSMDDERLATFEDTYIWQDFITDKKINISGLNIRKWFAIAMIILGVSMLWHYVSGIIYRLIPDASWHYVYGIVDGIPSVAVGVAIIIVGFNLIRGKKKEIEADTEVAVIETVADDKAKDKEEEKAKEA